MTLGTLANRTGVLSPGPTMTRGGRILSLRLQAAIQVLTAGDGPHSLWLLTSDLSLAEFEAYLELNGPVTPSDITASEVASRGKYVRYLGMLIPSGNGTIAALSLKDVSMSGLKWSEEGEAGGFQFCVYNEGQAMTTGAICRISAQNFVEWNASG